MLDYTNINKFYIHTYYKYIIITKNWLKLRIDACYKIIQQRLTNFNIIKMIEETLLTYINN